MSGLTTSQLLRFLLREKAAALPKVVLRKLLESTHLPLAPQVRSVLLLRQLHLDARLTRKVASALCAPVLTSTNQVFDAGASDTVFILGGGSSVNRLPSRFFDQMRNHESIGINFWPIHPFPPKILATETDNVPGPPSNATDFLSQKIGQSPLRDTLATVLTLRPPFPPNSERLYRLPPEIAARSFLYGRANLITRFEDNLVQDLERAINILWGRRRVTALPDNGSSIVRMTFLALAHGFTKIVWVGVDQDGRGYFWSQGDSGDAYAEARRLFPRKAGEPHSTSSAEDRPFSNDVFLRALSSAAERSGKAKIFLSSGESTLADEIPIYESNSV